MKTPKCVYISNVREKKNHLSFYRCCALWGAQQSAVHFQRPAALERRESPAGQWTHPSKRNCPTQHRVCIRPHYIHWYMYNPCVSKVTQCSFLCAGEMIEGSDATGFGYIMTSSICPVGTMGSLHVLYLHVFCQGWFCCMWWALGATVDDTYLLQNVLFLGLYPHFTLYCGLHQLQWQILLCGIHYTANYGWYLTLAGVGLLLSGRLQAPSVF